MQSVHSSKTLRKTSLVFKPLDYCHGITSFGYFDVGVQKAVNYFLTNFVYNVTGSGNTHSKEMWNCAIFYISAKSPQCNSNLCFHCNWHPCLVSMLQLCTKLVAQIRECRPANSKVSFPLLVIPPPCNVHETSTSLPCLHWPVLHCTKGQGISHYQGHNIEFPLLIIT